MPLNPAIVGQTTKKFTHDVDARWIMAYASGLGDTIPPYMDTTADQPVVAHPLFPVCLEWPAILDCANLAGSESVLPEERSRGVHAAHDLHIYRPIRAGEQLTTTATVIGVEERKPGGFQHMRLDTHDEAGELVARTWQLSIMRGVRLAGDAVWSDTPTPLPAFNDAHATNVRYDIPVSAGAAHIYTECAHIWNPIHTDRAVALAAGLPDIILHGTATLALAISKIVETCLNGDPTRVTRVGGRFAAMVLMPSTITLEILQQGSDGLAYRVLNAEGQEAISGGFLCWQNL